MNTLHHDITYPICHLPTCATRGLELPYYVLGIYYSIQSEVHIRIIFRNATASKSIMKAEVELLGTEMRRYIVSKKTSNVEEEKEKRKICRTLPLSVLPLIRNPSTPHRTPAPAPSPARSAPSAPPSFHSASSGNLSKTASRTASYLCAQHLLMRV